MCSDDFSGASAQIRIGTPEVTRFGMKEAEMQEIAKFFKRAIIDKESTEILAKEVGEFVKDFDKPRYCFEN